VNALAQALQRRPGQLLAQVDLDGLDVVAGDGLDLLDAGRLRRAEARRQIAQEAALGGGQRAEEGHAGVGGQGDEVLDFDVQPGADQGEFGEAGAQRLDGLGVAAVQGREGEQRIGAHGAPPGTDRL